VKRLFQRWKIFFFLASPLFVLLFFGLVLYRQNISLKSSVPKKTQWEKFETAIESLRGEEWKTKVSYPFRFYYQGEVNLERVQSDLSFSLEAAQAAFSRRFNQPLRVYLLKPEQARRVLGKEKSYVYLKEDPFALLSLDYSQEEMNLFTSRLVSYSLSNSDSSYWLREGLAQYFAFEVLGKREGFFSPNETSDGINWIKLEKTGDIYALNEKEREDFCWQSARVVSYVFARVGREKLSFLTDSLSAGSSGLTVVSYLTNQSIADFKAEMEKELSSKKSPSPEKEKNRGRDLSRLALNFYLITVLAILLGSALTYYLSYRLRD